MQSDLELSPIGNCQVSTLVDSEGAFVWGCVPRVDGDPVFCSLLNDNARDRGIWRFELEGQARSSQRYERNTAILITRLEAEDGTLHPMQQAVLDEQGFQCAFCMSGFIMNTVALLNENSSPTRKEAAEWLSGNLCRCADYDKILTSVMRAAAITREA